MHTMPMGSSRGKIAMVMGMSTPNVPQLVPVAKASRQPIRNTMAGRNICMPSAPLFTRSRTKYFAPRESVMAFSDHANVRIIMAGTIALKPSGMQPIISHCPAQHIINEAEHQSECGPKHQPYRRVGV